MTVAIERTGNPVFPWQVVSPCKSLAEAEKKCLLVDAVNAEAFLPVTAEEIALAAGEAATGGGLATHYVEPAPEPEPAIAALIAQQEAGEDVIDALNFDKPAGEAVQ